MHQDASDPAGGQKNQAIGRTKGGLNTKLMAWVDGCGRPMQVALSPGQRADVPALAQTNWPRGLRGKTVVGDKGYDSEGLRASIGRRGGRSCISPRARQRQPVSWHRVENFFQRAKRYRRVGPRYEKHAVVYTHNVARQSAERNSTRSDANLPQHKLPLYNPGPALPLSYW